VGADLLAQPVDDALDDAALGEVERSNREGPSSWAAMSQDRHRDRRVLTPALMARSRLGVSFE
jgi:hypothetical protein